MRHLRITRKLSGSRELVLSAQSLPGFSLQIFMREAEERLSMQRPGMLLIIWTSGLADMEV